MTRVPADHRSVGDEVLYVRLLRVKERFPRDVDAGDYDRRRDAWEAEHAAIEAEISRRGASPPPWWNAANGVPTRPRRRWRLPVLLLLGYVSVSAVAIAAFGGPAVAVVFWTTVLGGGATVFVWTQFVAPAGRRR